MKVEINLTRQTYYAIADIASKSQQIVNYGEDKSTTEDLAILKARCEYYLRLPLIQALDSTGLI